MALISRFTSDPVLAEFVGLSNRLGRLLNDGNAATTAWAPPVDIFEEGDDIRITAEIPGVRPEDVKLSVENNILTVQGSKQQVAEQKSDRVHRYERTYGAFERSFTLPASVDPSKIHASYEHGVLTVSLPKAERAKPRQIEVQVTSK